MEFSNLWNFPDYGIFEFRIYGIFEIMEFSNSEFMEYSNLLNFRNYGIFEFRIYGFSDRNVGVLIQTCKYSRIVSDILVTRQ